jgi:predicted component of type VI protein secretion system
MQASRAWRETLAKVLRARPRPHGYASEATPAKLRQRSYASESYASARTGRLDPNCRRVR